MKHIILYESFITEAVKTPTMEITAVKQVLKTLNIPIEAANNIILAFETQKELAKILEKAKKYEVTLKKYNDNVMSMLDKYQLNNIRVGDILVEILKKKGVESRSYKNISDDLLKLIKNQDDAINKIYKLHTKKPEIKKSLHYTKVPKKANESIGDTMSKAWESLKGWFKEWYGQLKDLLPKFEKSVDDLEASVKSM